MTTTRRRAVTGCVEAALVEGACRVFAGGEARLVTYGIGVERRVPEAGAVGVRRYGVLAETIAVRHGRAGEPLRATGAPIHSRTPVDDSELAPPRPGG